MHQILTHALERNNRTREICMTLKLMKKEGNNITLTELGVQHYGNWFALAS